MPKTIRHKHLPPVLAALLLLSTNPAAASIDQAVESFMAPITASISAIVFYKLSLFGYQVPWIVLWLAVAATFFTLYLGFINIRGFGLAFRLVRGDYHDPRGPGRNFPFPGGGHRGFRNSRYR